MIITLLIILGALILLKFALDLNKQKDYIKKQGGMLMKYQVLVDNILLSSPGLNLEEETDHAITLASDDKIPGKTIIILTQTFKRLTIKWKTSHRYGKDYLEWEFDEFYDQDKIFNKINHDIAEYNKNIIENRKRKALKKLKDQGEIPVKEVPEDIKPKNKINNRQRSLEEMAKNMNTTPEFVKEKFIEGVKAMVTSKYEKEKFLKELKHKKIEESEVKGIDPDDGIGAHMEKWAKEYFGSKEFNKTIKETEFKKIIESGNQNELTNYLRKHPELIDVWMNEYFQKNQTPFENPNKKNEDHFDLPF